MTKYKLRRIVSQRQIILPKIDVRFDHVDGIRHHLAREKYEGFANN